MIKQSLTWLLQNSAGGEALNVSDGPMRTGGTGPDNTPSPVYFCALNNQDFTGYVTWPRWREAAGHLFRTEDGSVNDETTRTGGTGPDDTEKPTYFAAVADPQFVRPVTDRGEGLNFETRTPEGAARRRQHAPGVERTGGIGPEGVEEPAYFCALNSAGHAAICAQSDEKWRTYGSKDDPIYFLAIDEDRTGELLHYGQPHLYPYLLAAVNEIDPGFERMIQETMDRGVKWFIDSGVYNLAVTHARNHGMSMDQALALPPEEVDGYHQLFEKYVDLLRRIGDRSWGYIEIDLGGRENKIKTRAKLEALGLRPTPVYHPLNDGWDYFDYLAQRYNRICFGNVVMADTNTRMRLVATAWERKRKYPNLWIHLLGYTPNERLNAYPIDSADSSSWLNVVRWREIKVKSALKTFSSLPKNFRYVLGEGTGPGSDYGKAVAMSAYAFAMDVRNWRNGLRAWEALGCTRYPEPTGELSAGVR